jgi:sn-glycerol 3-phosphate transport system substrate-binding protein
VTIQVFYPVAVDAPVTKILQGYADEFHKQNPNITVDPVFSGGYTDVKTAIQTTIEGGGKPPAMAVMLSTDIYDLINAGYIVPLDSYINAMPDGKAYIDDFFPAFLDNSRYDNKIWSIPFQRSDVVLYYNADLFQQANLKPPDSWDSWAQDAQQLTERQGDKVTRWGLEFPSDFPYWLFQPLAIGAGQNIVGQSDTKVYFDNPQVISAIQFYIDLSHKYQAMPEGVQTNWGTAPTDFASGQTAMIMHSSGSLATILSQAKFKVGVMPVPGKETGTYASVPGGGNMYILDGATQQEKDAAWKFIQFLTTPDNAADFSIKTGYIATRQSAYDTQAMKDYIAKVPQAAATRDALKYAQAEFAVQDLGEIRTSFNDYLQKAFNGDMTPEAAMQAAQKEADQALQAFK